MPARTYVLILLACAIAIAGAPAAINLHADPYGLRSSTATPENYRPNAIIRDERTAKILRARTYGADVLILGTSRTAIGIDPSAAAFNGKRVYNLAFGGQSLRESRLLMEQVVPLTGAREVYIGLDFFAANVYFRGKEDLTAHLAAAPAAVATVETVVSWQTFEHSRALLAAQPAYAADQAGNYDSVTGALRWSPGYVRAHGGPRAMFAESERAYVTDNYRPAPGRAFALSSPALHRDAQQEFSLLLRAAYRHKLKLHLFISPSHARQWTTLASLGLWNQFEAWKTMLAITAEAEALAQNNANLVVWDFSDYSAPQLERLPVGVETMQHYWDSSHYRPELGAALLERMRNGAGANAGANTSANASVEAPAESNFGAPLNTATLEAHLQRIRERRAAYEQAQPDDVREIAEMVKRVLATTSGPTASTTPAPQPGRPTK